MKKYVKPGQVPAAYSNPLVKESYQALEERNRWELWLEKGDIALAMRSMEKELRLLTGSTNEQMFRMGEILVAAKKIVGHGKFGDWIKNNVPFSERTANNYMNVYKMCLGQQELLEQFGRSALEEICKPNFAEDLRDLCFDGASIGYKITLKEINIIRKEIVSGNVDIGSCEAQNFFFKFQQINVESYNMKIVNDLLLLLSNFRERLKRNIVHANVNQLLNCKSSKLDILPIVIRIVDEFTYELKDVREVVDIGLPFDREKFLKETRYFKGDRKNIVTHDIAIMAKIILEDPNGDRYVKHAKRVDDGTLPEEYDRWLLEQLGPEDFISCEDEGILAEQWEARRISKIIGELEPSDFLQKGLDDGTFAKEYYQRLYDQLGPEDITSCEDADETAEEYDSMVQ